ncbi:hypothetical protein K402DRAFT_436875, partial [Aulographum hederae CBS 113979]
SSVSSIPKFLWCLNSSIKCTFGQIHTGGTAAPIFCCQVCGFKQCAIDHCAWHEGESCEEYRVRTARVHRENEAKSKKYLKRFPPCPNKECRARIAKEDGCDHMTCACKHEFCWICQAPFALISEYGNYFHKRTCEYYSNVR